MLRGRSGLFARREVGQRRIRTGDRLRYRSPIGVIETAEVLGVSADATGIPHVRFRVTIERPFQGRRVEGPKVLNLQTFLERYRETVAPPQARAAE